MSELVLKATNVVKRFPGTIALKGVSFELYQGEILALVGENGAGKSTLMKILSGAYSHAEYEGEIVLSGKTCSFAGPRDAERAGIAMIYQELNLELDLSIAENICLGQFPMTKLGTIDWSQVNRNAQEVLKQVGLNIDVGITTRNLSPSMQQLVCIARALIRHPRVLILDEPTSVLTEKEADALMQVVRKLSKDGISCIYISHKLDEIFTLCDRVVVFRDGEKISEHQKRDGYNSAIIIEDMIGHHLDFLYPKRVANIGEEVLRAEHYSVPHPYAYGQKILTDVSINLRKGEILGLAGLVGSGRSELAAAIFGYGPKNSGELFVNGKKVKISNPTEAIKNGIGFLSEDRKKNGYVWSMDITQNMTLASLKQYCKGMFINQQIEIDKANVLFDKLKIKAPSIKTSITSLSGGNQQKVILSKWLLTDINIVIFDEPTRGIDVGTKSEIYKLMQNLTEQGISIIMISSEMPELLAMCDRIVVLGKGVVQDEFKMGEVDEIQLMQSASCVSDNNQKV